METVLARAGWWLAALFVAVVAAAAAVDSAFAVQMLIIAAAAFVGLWLSVSRTDYGAIARGILRTPADPGRYDDDPIRWGVIATVFWGMAGFLAGLFIALQLAFPWLNVEPYLNFGRVRPLHTSAVIFAFGGNALIATSFYVVQRTCRARLAFPSLARQVRWTT